MSLFLNIFFVLLISLSPSLVTMPPSGSFFIVWNVGQGQWVTAIERHQCLHFDAGGEFFPLRQILHHCTYKKNVLYISHWDWDHTGALSKFKVQRKLQPCFAELPLGRPKKINQHLRTKIPLCAEAPDFKVWRPTRFKKSNDASTIYRYKKILLPGDSPQAQEKVWASKKDFRTHILVLGHHGSKTSTSLQLLENLPHLKLAISSAREKKYGHPHSEVLSRLRRYNVPWMRTEDWGNIWFDNP